jgi:hypothetical protein
VYTQIHTCSCLWVSDSLPFAQLIVQPLDQFLWGLYLFWKQWSRRRTPQPWRETRRKPARVITNYKSNLRERVNSVKTWISRCEQCGGDNQNILALPCWWRLCHLPSHLRKKLWHYVQWCVYDLSLTFKLTLISFDSPLYYSDYPFLCLLDNQLILLARGTTRTAIFSELAKAFRKGR